MLPSPMVPILPLLLSLIAVGVVLYCINRFVPMDAKVKTILNIVVILVLVVWLLQAFGLFEMLSTVRVPRAHR